MCGIAGALWWDASNARDANAIVSRMVDALRHRGPDGRGVVCCNSGEEGAPSITLGHTRLAILDLSARGAQPMRSERGPVWITFNGEVYNFESIRRELESCGRRFQSQ